MVITDSIRSKFKGDPDDVIQNICCRKIQRAYRVKRARRLMREKIRLNYVKLYDRVNKTSSYKNKLTGEISDKKPAFLGDDDLPIPKQYNAPINYDANEVEDDAYALIITCSEFDHPKINPLPLMTQSDHTMLENCLPHSFVCKFREENVFSIRNPKRSDVRECFERMRRVCKKKGFFLLYICTHVATVWKGEPKDSSVSHSETAYFLVQDTVYKDAKSICTTSIALQTLATWINEISCDRKTILLNYGNVFTIDDIKPLIYSLFQLQHIKTTLHLQCLDQKFYIHQETSFLGFPH